MRERFARPTGDSKMNALHEYSLLFVVATPVLAFVVAHIALRMAGEHGTLLLPELGDLGE